ncbi:MAG: hypothetical protein VX902_06745, partial [Planctomycetota bacterium]|nr:hypothetical protein [Planctomycetota bacterium]
MTTWTLRSLFGVGGERNTVKNNRLRRHRDKQWRKRRAARDQYNPESLEPRAMMAVVAPDYEVC